MADEARPTDRLNGSGLELPSVLDLGAAQALCQSLRGQLLAGTPLILAGSLVERVSTAAIQVLLAAAAAARRQGLAFYLRDPSPALADALADLGLPPDFSQ